MIGVPSSGWICPHLQALQFAPHTDHTNQKRARLTSNHRRRCMALADVSFFAEQQSHE